MPNYRYQAQDCQRRQGRGYPNQGMQQRGTMQQTAMHQANMRHRAADQAAGRCLPDSRTLSDLPIAMAYVPWQEWCGILQLEKGLCCGTIFEELNKPFTGAGGRR